MPPAAALLPQLRWRGAPIPHRPEPLDSPLRKLPRLPRLLRARARESELLLPALPELRRRRVARLCLPLMLDANLVRLRPLRHMRLQNRSRA